MRLAIIAALAPDRRSGQVVSGILPADQAIAQVKAAIAANQMFEGHPHLAAFALDSPLRQHRFREDAAEVTFPQDAAAQDEGHDLITVELGEGDEKTVLNVTTEEEATFVRGLASSLTTLAAKVAKLEAELKKAGK